MNLPSWLQSSDPNASPEQISLSVESFLKSLSGLVVVLAMWFQVDPVVAQTQFGVLVAAVVTAIPAAYTVWHAGQMIFGIARKVLMALVKLFQKKPSGVTP